VSGVRAQPASDDSLRIPEDYFPGLKTLLETALKQSSRMIANNANEVIAETDRVSMRAGQLPTVGGYGSYYPWDRERRGSAPDPVTVGNNKKVGYNFSLNQPVYAWGALHNNTKIGELRLKMAQGQTADAYRLLVGEIRTQYLQLIVKKAGLARVRLNQRIADDALALARSKQEKNVISEADLFGPTIAAEQARLWTDRTEFEYESSKVLFGKLCGVPPLTDEEIPEAIPAVSPASASIDRVVAEFTGHGEPDTYYLRNLRRGIEVERLNYKIVSTRLKPKVNAVAGVSQDDQVFGFADQTARYKIQSAYAGVSVSWNVFDGFATRSAKIASLTRRRELERSYKEQSADLLVALQNQKRQLEFSTRSLAITEKLLGSAANGVKVAEDDLKRGLTSDAAVDAARLNFYGAQLETYAARNDYLMRVAELLSTTLRDPALANLPSRLR